MGKYDEGLAPSQNRIRKVMTKGRRKYWKPWQVQVELNLQGYKRLSESTVTREMRRMKDMCNRYCSNDSWDYWLDKESKGC